MGGPIWQNKICKAKPECPLNTIRWILSTSYSRLAGNRNWKVESRNSKMDPGGLTLQLVLNSSRRGREFKGLNEQPLGLCACHPNLRFSIGMGGGNLCPVARPDCLR